MKVGSEEFKVFSRGQAQNYLKKKKKKATRAPMYRTQSSCSPYYLTDVQGTIRKV